MYFRSLNNLKRATDEYQKYTVSEKINNLPVEERIDYLTYNEDYEIDLENLEILETLGSGQFGIVKKGYLNMASSKNFGFESRLSVAIKSNV